MKNRNFPPFVLRHVSQSWPYAYEIVNLDTDTVVWRDEYRREYERGVVMGRAHLKQGELAREWHRNRKEGTP